ncbi:Methionine--tRNA ligase, mitochondrial, partial [Coemansia furcata]
MYACSQFLSHVARVGPRAGQVRCLSATATLREKDASKYFVTQPIFYVNSVPHIGHFYTVVLADVIKRYAGMQGKSTKMSAGTDEHGLKIQQAAERVSRDTLLFCTQYSDRFRDLQAAANVDNPDFIRTTDPQHRLA